MGGWVKLYLNFFGNKCFTLKRWVGGSSFGFFLSSSFCKEIGAKKKFFFEGVGLSKVKVVHFFVVLIFMNPIICYLHLTCISLSVGLITLSVETTNMVFSVKTHNLDSTSL